MKAPSELNPSLQSRARSGKRWPWPRAAVVIILASLVLWGAITTIALLAFN